MTVLVQFKTHIKKKKSFHFCFLLCFVGVELKGRAWFGRRKREAFAMAPVVKLAGVDKELKKILEANMDQVPARRRAREAFKDIQLQIDHILFKVFSFL